MGTTAGVHKEFAILNKYMLNIYYNIII